MRVEDNDPFLLALDCGLSCDTLVSGQIGGCRATKAFLEPYQVTVSALVLTYRLLVQFLQKADCRLLLLTLCIFIRSRMIAVVSLEGVRIEFLDKCRVEYEFASSSFSWLRQSFNFDSLLRRI